MSDGLNNITELFLGTDPNDVQSGFKVTFDGDILEWTTQKYDVYRVESSGDLTTWVQDYTLQQEEDEATMSLSMHLGSEGRRFYRVKRVP